MCKINSFFESKTYVTSFSNNDGRRITKELNWFQQFLRKVFGCYSETHLKSLEGSIIRAALHLGNRELNEINDLMKKVFPKNDPQNGTKFVVTNRLGEYVDPIGQKYGFNCSYDPHHNMMTLIVEKMGTESISVDIIRKVRNLVLSDIRFSISLEDDSKEKIWVIFTTFLQYLMQNSKSIPSLVIEQSHFNPTDSSPHQKWVHLSSSDSYILNPMPRLVLEGVPDFCAFDLLMIDS